MTERVTLITGASAGIGTELARIFSANGHRVALVARRADRLDQLAGEIVAAGGAQPIVIPCDLEQARRTLMADCAGELQALAQQEGVAAITELPDTDEVFIRYPVLEFPARVSAFNLDKSPTVEGTLLGIKGQYLIFDTGVINMRKYGGYHLTLEVAG